MYWSDIVESSDYHQTLIGGVLRMALLVSAVW